MTPTPLTAGELLALDQLQSDTTAWTTSANRATSSRTPTW